MAGEDASPVLECRSIERRFGGVVALNGIDVRIARGEISLHGWFVDIGAGQVLGLDGETNRFVPIREDRALPVALPAAERLASESRVVEAAE